eukprot:scaffold703_cov168-Amphora_coffeaeformis.AAC.1
MPNPLQEEGGAPGYSSSGKGGYDAHIGLEIIHRGDDATEGVSGLTREHEESSSLPGLDDYKGIGHEYENGINHHDAQQQAQNNLPSGNAATTRGDQPPVTTPQQGYLPAKGHAVPPSATSGNNRSDESNKSCYGKHMKWIHFGGAVLLVVIVSVLVGAVLGSRGRGDDDRVIDNSNPSKRTHIPSKAELTRVVDLGLRVSGAQSVESPYGSIEDWDVSRISDFSQLFDALDRNPMAARFNADISGWDMSAATSTFAMFRSAAAFNQDLSSWDVSRVRDFSYTFTGAASFNQDLSSWPVGDALTIQSMFESATSFSQDLCSWAGKLPTTTKAALSFADTACETSNDPVGSVGPFCAICASSTTVAPTVAATASPTAEPRCFSDPLELLRAVDNYLQDPSGGLTSNKYGHPIGSCVDRNPLAASFNEDLSEWDTSASVSMPFMFRGAWQFNQDLSAWGVSRVFDFGFMFANCTRFNANISGWDTSSAFWMDGMFEYAAAFDQDLRGWDVSSVEDFGLMFSDASRFNADLSEWNVGSGIDFGGMFWGARRFSSDLSGWRTSQATNMIGMFLRATVFSSDLSSWQVSRVTNMYGMFLGAEVFNSNISSWDVDNVLDMEDMFFQTSSFRQNLCPWGVRVGAETLVGTMFEGTSCPSQSDPLLTVDPPGPFCFACGE